MTKKNQTTQLEKQSVYSESDGGKNTRRTQKRRRQPRIQRKDIRFKEDRNRLHKQRHTQKPHIS